MNNATLIKEFTTRSFEEKYSIVFTMVQKLSQKNDNFASIYYSLETVRPSENFLTVIYAEILALYSHHKDIETAQNIKKYESLINANTHNRANKERENKVKKEADEILLSL